MISVVVPTYNSAAVIARCLSSLVSILPIESEIVVVDNASSDGTQDIVAGFDRATLVTNAANVGFGAACNAGLRVARGDWAIIANPDVFVEVFDAAAFAAAAAGRGVGILALSLGGSAEAADRTPLLGRYPQWWSGVVRFSWGLVQPRRWGEVLRSLSSEPASNGLWASGALFAVRREAWETVGGFDERFFLYFEDVDLSRRVQAAGYRVSASSAVRAWHAHGGSSGFRDPALAAAWAAASWLLYVSVWEGRRRAHRAARLLLANLRLVGLALGLSLVLAPRSDKLTAKRREATHVASVIREGLFGGGAGEERSPAHCVALAVGALPR